MRKLDGVTVRESGQGFVLSVRDATGETIELEASAAQLEAAARALADAHAGRREGGGEVYQKPLG